MAEQGTDIRKVESVEPDSPLRCQAVHGAGQCRYKASPGSTYCPMHGGNNAQQLIREKVKRQYQLAKWQQAVDAFADEDQVKGLRGEIGIARLLLESVVTKCRDTGDLLMYSGKISELLSRVEKLVVSCHRLESNLGLVLDKPKVLALAAQVVEVVGRHVKDDDAISRIANEIVNAVVATQGKTSGD
jgi:hypothetical protein